MDERNLSEGQWEDKKQWSLCVRQRRKAFWNRYMDGLMSAHKVPDIFVRLQPILIFPDKFW
jgi:hypothetical protein